jgi:hypothetical protein
MGQYTWYLVTCSELSIAHQTIPLLHCDSSVAPHGPDSPIKVDLVSSGMLMSIYTH